MHEYRVCTYKDTGTTFFTNGRRFYMPCVVYLDPQSGKPFKHEPISFIRRHEYERDLRIEMERIYESMDLPILDLDNNYEEIQTK